MSEAPPDGPDVRRALLAVVAVLGLVTASISAPALAGQAPLGDVDSPSEPSDVPGFLRGLAPVQELLGQNQQSAPPVGSGGAFGALGLTEAVDVGGPMSAEQRQDSVTPHFLVQTTEPTYWRTGAYAEYTGSGWERGSVDDMQPTSPVADRRETTHEVTLRRPATSLPAPWRPTDVEYDCTGAESCEVDVERTDTGSARAEPALPSGEAYEVETLEPVSDPSLLRQVRVDGTIAATAYTSVETTDRVRRLADRVAGDPDNRYDAARAVESYLEAEKTYSLSDVPEPGDQVADQFLFEQDHGYCEHYATAMTVLLRAQDVPARYVAGYASGERVGDNRYLVRGADAHAWVEVYFEDYGWVRFDPTPGAPREEARDALHGGHPDFRVSLNRTAVPGEDVTANVTTGGLPARGVAVDVNGERVGTTDASGEIEFAVPYAEELNVTVRPTDTRDSERADWSGNRAGSLAAGSPVDSPGSGDRLAYSLRDPVLARAGGAGDGPVLGADTTTWTRDDRTGRADDVTTQTDDDATNRTHYDVTTQTDDNGTTQQFDVAADVQFSFEGDVEPRTDLPVVVTIEGHRFANASVSVAGEPQGRTDENGATTVRIPADESGVVELTASRGNLTKTTTYPLDDLSVSVSPSLVAPLPSTDATARVTSGGEAVEGAVVRLNGDRVGVTDENGRATVTIPASRVPSVSATASDKTAVTYVDGVLPTLALAVLAALGALSAVVVAARRRGVTVAGVISTVRYVASELASAVVGGLVAFADTLDGLVAEFREAADEGWREVLSWLASLPGRVSLPDVRGWIAGVVAGARDESQGRTAPGTNSGEAAANGRLQAVWRQFVGLVGVQEWHTKTPTEAAREAVDRGFPRQPVYALTDAFRDVAYGGHDADSRLDAAREGLASLRETADTDADETEEETR